MVRSVKDSTIPVLNEIIKKTRKEEYKVKREEREQEREREELELKEQQELFEKMAVIGKKILNQLDPKEMSMFKAETFFALENNNSEDFYRIAHTYIRKFAINAKKSQLQKLLKLFKTIEKQIIDKPETEFIYSYDDFKRIVWTRR